MTSKEWAKELSKSAIGVIITVCGSMLIFFLTGFYTEKEQIKDKVNELDKVKASTEYVDKKCLEVQTKSEKDRSEIMERLDRMEVKQDKTLDYIIELNKRK